MVPSKELTLLQVRLSCILIATKDGPCRKFQKMAYSVIVVYLHSLRGASDLGLIKLYFNVLLLIRIVVFYLDSLFFAYVVFLRRGCNCTATACMLVSMSNIKRLYGDVFCLELTSTKPCHYMSAYEFQTLKVGADGNYNGACYFCHNRGAIRADIRPIQGRRNTVWLWVCHLTV